MPNRVELVVEKCRGTRSCKLAVICIKSHEKIIRKFDIRRLKCFHHFFIRRFEMIRKLLSGDFGVRIELILGIKFAEFFNRLAIVIKSFNLGLTVLRYGIKRKLFRLCHLHESIFKTALGILIF